MMQRPQRSVTSRAAALLSLLLLGAAAGCDHATSVDDPDLAGGVLATFRVVDQEFSVWTSSDTAIAQLRALRDGESRATIPVAPLLEGPGRGDHNDPWSWHLDPEALRMAEMTIEVCDGRPSMVEENLTYWLETVGSYCPWSAELVRLEDFR